MAVVGVVVASEEVIEVEGASEVEEEDEAQVVVAMLVMRVKVMEEKNSSQLMSRISLTRSRGEKLADQMTKETLLLVITVVLSSIT